MYAYCEFVEPQIDWMIFNFHPPFDIKDPLNDRATDKLD